MHNQHRPARLLVLLLLTILLVTACSGETGNQEVSDSQRIANSGNTSPRSKPVDAPVQKGSGQPQTSPPKYQPASSPAPQPGQKPQPNQGPQPDALDPQMEACFQELLSQEAFQAIYKSGSRPPTEAEKTLLERCYKTRQSETSGRQQETSPNSQQPSDTSGPSIIESVFGTDLTGCSNKVTKFDAPPVALAQIVHIEPMGKMAGISGHITPTDHLYIRATSTGPKSIPVQAIADGFLVKITRMPDREGLPDWRAIIEHSCSVFSWYIHLDVFSETILQQITIPSDRAWHGRIPLKSGEPVGYVGEMLSYQQGFDVDTDDFDWAVTDTSTVLPGFIIPDHYRGEAWKIHSVDPFDYYDDPLKNALRKKSLRTAAPVGGKIDFDIDGRLVGNWFLDGTRDYFASGLAEAGESAWAEILGMDPGNCKTPLWDNDLRRDIGYTPCAYFRGHAVFAYEYRDPDIVMVSLGLHYDGYGGAQAPWIVLNNGPDPAQVSIDTGQVKYELVESNASTGDLARQEPPSGNDVPIGTLLVEMLDARSIKVELFIGMRADTVDGFTELARIYRR